MKLLAASLASLLIVACGTPGNQSSRSNAPATDAPQAVDIASSDPEVQYFHVQLVDNGDDVQSEFGTYLSMLGMNARDLQQDDPQHAYDTVLEEVQALDDADLRRDMMRAFFNRTDTK